MTAGPARRGVDLRIVALLAIALLAALGGAAAWAATTNGDLGTTRAAVAAADGRLAMTKGSLADTEARLKTTEEALATERAAIKQADSRTTALNALVDRKAACIAVQATNVAEIRRILALERANFARTTTGSKWGKAEAARSKAIHNAIQYLYNAYTNALAGRYDTANSWVSKSNAQISVNNSKVRTANREIKAIDAATARINKATDAFFKTLGETAVTCGN